MAASTQVHSEGQSAGNSADTFSSIALKYAFVFDLGKESRILLLGPYFQAISQDLRLHFTNVHSVVDSSDLNPPAADESYDLICLDAYSAWSDSRVGELIGTARSYLATDGSLVVAATNRLAIDRLLARLRRRAVSLMPGLSPGGYKKAISTAGFTGVVEFMVFPSLRTADEYVTTAHGDIELPAYASILHKIFQWLHLYRFVHGDFLYIARADARGGFDAFTQQVDRQITAHGQTYNPLHLERFDMRDRGALMFMLSDSTKKHRVVARVAVSAAVNSVIAKNTSFTDRIHALNALDTRIKALIPKTVAAFEYRGCHVYVENRIPGVLVWKVSGNKRIDERAYAQAFEFINAFNIATAKEKTIDPGFFDELVGHDLASILSAMVEIEGVDVMVRNIERLLHQHLKDRTVTTVWGHGDFGYGNILCDPSSGSIQGIIDWDTHVQHELPGVDLCNLVLQKTSREFDGDVAQAMEKLYQTIVRDGVLDSALPQYGKGGSRLTPLDFEISLCFAGIRMIKRSIPYRKEFLLRKASYASILRVTDRILSETLNKNQPRQM